MSLPYRSKRSRAPGALAAALVLPVVLLTGPASRAQGPASDDALESTRATLAQWMEIQQIIAKERKDWQLGKEVLEQRISLLEGELDGLEEKIRVAREGLDEASRKRGEMTRDQEALSTAGSVLRASIASLEAGTLALVRSVPDPLRERVNLLSGRIPVDPDRTTLSLGQRYQNVIGVLNEINKFNQDITVANELRELPGGGTAEVSTLYLGLGQAWYVTENGEAAGVGHPTPEGWEWTAANDRAPEIIRALRILRNEEVPAYVSLPVSIR